MRPFQALASISLLLSLTSARPFLNDKRELGKDATLKALIDQVNDLADQAADGPLAGDVNKLRTSLEGYASTEGSSIGTEDSDSTGVAAEDDPDLDADDETDSSSASATTSATATTSASVSSSTSVSSTVVSSSTASDDTFRNTDTPVASEYLDKNQTVKRTLKCETSTPGNCRLFIAAEVVKKEGRDAERVSNSGMIEIYDYNCKKIGGLSGSEMGALEVDKSITSELPKTIDIKKQSDINTPPLQYAFEYAGPLYGMGTDNIPELRFEGGKGSTWTESLTNFKCKLKSEGG